MRVVQIGGKFGEQKTWPNVSFKLFSLYSQTGREIKLLSEGYVELTMQQRFADVPGYLKFWNFSNSKRVLIDPLYT